MAAFGYMQPTEIVFFQVFFCFLRIVTGIAAQLGFDPRHQFKRLERLCNIIIRTERQPCDFIHVFHLCGQHNNRKQTLFPDFLAQRKSIHIRQHHI